MTTMNLWRSYAAMMLAALLVIAGQLFIAPSPASASSIPPPEVPTTIAVPAEAVLLFSSHARGVQIYECRNGEWAFHAPRALLFDPEAFGAIGKHYGGIDQGITPGPWWESIDDGSRIRGGNPVSAPSPNPDSIPQLRLDVLQREGAGIFSEVDIIQRLNTLGGVGPTGSCVAGMTRQVVYSTDYYFYAMP